MNRKKLRDTVFYLHQYIGLFVGLVLVIVGLTGSLLVFEQDFDHFMISQQYGYIIPQQVQLSPESVVNTIEAKYPAQGDFHLFRIYLPDTPSSPYVGQLSSTDVERTEVFINPYTGKIIGERISDKTLIGVILNLHYSLMAGETGTMFVGIAAFLMCILTITGLVLWPGWRKLIAGFKIKLDAHPKRVNFDIHKVAGIIAVIFLFFTSFTGFCWSFSFPEPIIYAVTFTPKPSEPVSKPIPSKSTLALTEQLKIADAALPGAVTKSIYFPSKPEDALQIRMKLPQENVKYGNSNVYLDQYTGEVLRVDNALKMRLGDRILNSFVPLHYGTFGGLPTRILYIFVGLAPLVLFVTSLVMWWYRYRAKTVVRDV
ncbi:PepSY-associated TM helix domain-containing protein [uncultured Nostoc sp.]|uniref:PepSY-associated TM helix domain-containing protein n=1 Tax=uncultured Nostoc sp. TaxID=340711 RepID=UPI0035C9C7EA